MRALELLTLMPRSAADVADALGIHPRTARRLLNRLVFEGYATRTSGRRCLYGMTLKLISVAGHALEEAHVVREALPFMRSVRIDAGRPAQLWVPSYRWVLPLVEETLAGDYRVSVEVGQRIPSHCTAPGKALLAARARWRESILRDPLETHTDSTIVEPAALRAELAQVAERGYAIDRGEFRADCGGVAAPVHDHHGDAVAALALRTTVEELAGEVLDGLARHLLRAAAGLSAVLGHVPGIARGGQEAISDAMLEMVPASRSQAA